MPPTSPTVFWSDLLIEKGKLDPLALWRVGDRLIAELLPSFTTVVGQRPARFFAMYCWILREASNGCEPDSNPEVFWGNFWEIEGIFLTAIQFHKPHTYEHFKGLIGSEKAGILADQIRETGTLDFSELRRENFVNGWDVNYKNPMSHFLLTEIDPAVPGGLRLTSKGKLLADAYELTISSSSFCQSHRDVRDLSVSVLENLAHVSCPCLAHQPSTGGLIDEQQVARELLIRPPTNTEQSDISIYQWQSIHLLLHFLEHLKTSGIEFYLEVWRRALTTNRIADGISYEPFPSAEDVFQRWQMYALDSLFVFSLESGLQGFLEFLQNNGPSLRTSRVKECVDLIFLQKAIERVGMTFDPSITVMNQMLKFTPDEHLSIETKLTNAIFDSSGVTRIALAYLLFLYCISQYINLKNDPLRENAVAFYEDRAYINDDDFSLYRVLNLVHGRSEIELFQDVFLHQSILNRQLETRSTRSKEVAWFSVSPPSESDSYNWEEEYNPNIYRASRLENVLGFLLNLDLVDVIDNRWAAVDFLAEDYMRWT